MAYRLSAVQHAATFIGVTEQPAGSNRGPRIDQWNMDACGVKGVYWCCSFVHGMFKLAGFDLPGGASVAALLAAAKTNGWVVPSGKKGQRPFRGDIACFDLNEGDRYGPFGDHTGIVEKVLALRWRDGRFTGWVQTVEGNTSSGVAGSQDNGGGVFRRRRWLTNIQGDFVRVPGAGA